MPTTEIHPSTLSAKDMDELAARLDAMNDDDRVSFIRATGAKTQARLWEASVGRTTTLTDLVPAGVAATTEVIHLGKNSLPLLNHFEKRFCRSADDPEAIYGYNEGATRPLIGPGYFVAREFPDRNEVGVDYFRVPPAGTSLPAPWPFVKPNEAGLQRFVFANMIDFLRKVSTHVTIGRAFKNGHATHNYFLLCRIGV